MTVSRRELLIAGLGLGCGAIGGGLLTSWWQGQEERKPLVPPSVEELVHGSLSAQRSLELLMEGHARFLTGKPTHPHESREWRSKLAREQHPYAVILGCSDSRVSPEVVFDEGLGGLFVVRQAGHVADDDTLGSVEYAVGHLHVPLVVVLGHQSCGAVQAAVGAVLREEAVEGHILRLVDDISPAVVDMSGSEERIVEAAVRANIRQVVQRLKSAGPILRPRHRKGEVRILGAYYALTTGAVEWFTT